MYGKQIITGMINFSNSGKVEMCGDKAVFSYVHSFLIKPSNG